MGNIIPKDPFPNAPGLSRLLGLTVKSILPPEFIGWGPWKKRWFSICSRHHMQRRSLDCTICRTGSYQNLWKLKLSSLLYKISPGLWYWWRT